MDMASSSVGDKNSRLQYCTMIRYMEDSIVANLDAYISVGVSLVQVR